MAGNTPALTPTIHITKPSKNIPGVDVYTEKRNTPINAIAKKIEEATAAFVKEFGGLVPKEVLLEATKGVTRIATGSMSMSDIADNVSNAYKINKSELKTIGSNATATILRGMGYPEDIDILVDGAFGIPGKQPIEEYFAKRSPAIRAILADGSVKKLITGEYSNAQDLGKLLGGIAGNGEVIKVFDGNAQFAIFKAIVDSARILNLPELYDTIREQIKDDDDRRRFLLDGAYQAAVECDIEYLKVVVKDTSVGRLRTVVPEIVSLLLSGYNRTYADSPSAGFQPVIDFINSIDSTWHQTTVNGKTYPYLASFMKASPDALDALQLDDRYRTSAMVANGNLVSESTAVELFKERYPISTLNAA